MGRGGGGTAATSNPPNPHNSTTTNNNTPRTPIRSHLTPVTGGGLFGINRTKLIGVTSRNVINLYCKT